MGASSSATLDSMPGLRSDVEKSGFEADYDTTRRGALDPEPQIFNSVTLQGGSEEEK
jgi:hypothetical protein